MLYKITAGLLVTFFIVACEPFQRVISVKPSFIDADNNIITQADTSFKQHKYEQAAKFYKELAGKNPTKIEYKLQMADSLRLAGKCEEALFIYKEVFSHTNKYSKLFLDAQEGSGLCYIQKGEFDRALNIFAILLAEDATRWKVINAQAVTLALGGNYKEAVEYYELALSLDPNSTSILNNLGFTQALMGATSQALKTLSRAAQNLNGDIEQKKRIELNLALVYAMSGNLPQAERIARTYLTDDTLKQTLDYYAMLKQEKQNTK